MLDNNNNFHGGYGPELAVPAVPGDSVPLHQIIWRRRNVMLLTLGACLGAALLWLLFSPRLYQSTARFAIQRGAAPSGADNRGAGGASDLVLGERERLGSRVVTALALSRPDTKDLRTFKDASSPIAYLRDHLSIAIDKANVMSVAVESPYKEEAPIIANAVVESFAQYQTQPKYSSVAGALADLATQTQAAQKELSDTTAKMRAIETRFGALSDGKSSSNAALAQLPAITQQLTTAKLEALKARSDFEEAERSLSPGTAQAARETAAPPAAPHQEADIQADLTVAQSRMLELRQRYLPEHPAIAQQQHRIDLLARQYAAALEARWLAAKRRTDSLQQEFDQQQRLAVDVSANTAEYERLRFDADRVHRQLQSLDARAQAIELARDAGAVTVDFFDPAEDSIRSQPRIEPTLLAAILGGLALGAMLALVREKLDDRLHSGDAAQNALGLPILGAVPTMPAGISSVLAAQRVTFDPGSDVAAAYRSIRSSIAAGAPRDRSRTFLITSPSSGDGKTTSAANLAIAMAQSGSRVLLVDANLRKPSLHTIFGIKQNNGLATLLAGRGKISKAVHPTNTRQLSLLPGGPIPANANPTELLNTPALAELLETLADQYDQVIIDGPAMKEEVDARIIAACCDLTVLVIRADATGRREAVIARDGLLGVGARILGLLMTLTPRTAPTPVEVAGGSALDLDEDAEPEPA